MSSVSERRAGRSDASAEAGRLHRGPFHVLYRVSTMILSGRLHSLAQWPCVTLSHGTMLPEVA